METALEELEKWGAKPREAIARVLGDEPLFRQLVQEFGENSDIDLLRLEIEQKKFPEAFRVAHSMKGASVSLSLEPLTEVLSDLTEHLRPYYEGTAVPGAVGEKELLAYYMHQVDRKWKEFCGIVLM